MSKLRAIKKAFRLERNRILIRISPVVATKFLYKKRFGKKLNLENPITFNEKLQWLKLYWRDPLVSFCGDKFTVREYVKKKKCEELLNELYWETKNVNTIDFGKLPEKFAIKGTHGCGYNLIQNGHVELDINKSKKQLKKWLKSRYALESAEINYDLMEPRIICEKFIDGNNGQFPDDYKVYCFNGKPHCVMICSERKEGKARYYFVDKEWNLLKYNKDSKSIEEMPFKKPKSFDEMFNYAEILSEGFPFVRVDFYDIKGKPMLGEMTFTPAAGLDTNYDEEVELLFGEKIILPNKLV